MTRYYISDRCCLQWCFYCCEKTQWPKATLGREGLVNLQILLREAKAGAEAEAMRNTAYWLAQTTQDHLPRVGTSFRGLGPPTLIIRQENALNTCLQAYLK